MINSSLPKYVANIAVRIESDSDGDTSSGEESDIPFPQSYFDDPLKYVRLAQKTTEAGKKPKTYKRGIVPLKRLPLPKPIHQRSVVRGTDFSNHRDRLWKQLTEESFGKSKKTSRLNSSERLKTVIGLNKMRSLSRSCNRSLPKAVGDFAFDYFSQDTWKVFGFFWEGAYQMYDSSNNQWIDLTYEDARKFYKQLKQEQGKEKASKFRKELEKTRGHLIPFRGIREAIKTSDQTRGAVKEFRQGKTAKDSFEYLLDDNNDDQANEQTEQKGAENIYLAILDDDSITLRAQDGNGVFSHYDDLIKTNGDEKGVHLEMGSCGYLFGQNIPNVKDPITRLASELDVWIRHETAQLFPYGVYYPEPSFILRVPSEEKKDLPSAS